MAEEEKTTRRRAAIIGLGATLGGMAGTFAARRRAGAATSTNPKDLCAPQMIGKTLRVVKPGEFVTQDFRTDRVTIIIDAKGRIERLAIG